MKTFLSILIFFAGVLHLTAQEGAWQYYFPGENATAVAASGNTILVATATGLVQFDTLGNKEHLLPLNSDIPSQDIRQVAIDASGHWWIHYGAGFARFDGTDWETWSNAEAGVSNTVRLLRAAPDGAIYAGLTTTTGVVVFQNGAWTSMTSANSGLPSNDVRDIAFGSDGKIYFATGAGLAILDGANWTIYNAANTGLSNFNNVKSVAVTAAGVIWVTEGMNRFAKFEAGAWTEYVAADIGLSGAGFSGKVLVDAEDRLWLSFSKSISLLSDGVWTHQLEAAIGCTLPPTFNLQLAVDGGGSLWTSWCNLTRFDGQNWTQPATGNSTLPAVYVITQDTEGNMWFGGRGSKSIAKKDPNDNWESFDPFELGVTADFNEVWSAHGDASGNVWFAMLNGEILRFDGAEWTLFDTVATAYDIFDTWVVGSGPDGSVWFSFLKAPFSALLARYQNGEWTFFSAPEDIPLPAGGAITSIAFTGNTTWFYSLGILIKFDGTNWETVTPPFSSGSAAIHKMAGAPDGALWISAGVGLLRYDGVEWTLLSTSNSDLPSENIYSVAFDQADGMYIGYSPGPTGANCAVSRNGEWMELLPPGFESAFTHEPWYIFVDQDNRFWFTAAYPSIGEPPGVLVYDPMIVGTEENELPATDLMIFPNPTTGRVRLNLAGNQQEETQLRITNLQGQTVYAASIPATESLTIDLDISHLPAGVYSVTVVQGEVVKVGKVVRG